MFENMGALFRIKIIQSYIAIICIGIALYSLVDSFTNWQSLLSLNNALCTTLPTLLIALGIGYFFVRSTFIIPVLIMLAIIGLFLLNGIESSFLFLWIGILLVLLVYPVFYYKYLNFNNMIAMLRLVVFFSSLATGYLGVESLFRTGNTLLAGLGLGLLIIGHLSLLFNYLKLTASIILASGIALMSYSFFIVNHTIDLLLVLQTGFFILVLHHDTHNKEPEIWSFSEHGYFKILTAAMLLLPILSTQFDLLESYLIILK